MTWKERYAKILKTENEIKECLNNNCHIENNIIKDIDILITGHFGNCVSIDVVCENICPFPLWNSTDNIGYIIRALIDIFDKEDDDSVNLGALKNTPIRIVYDNENQYGGKAVAIGHYMKDRFVFIEDLMQLDS